MGFPARKRHSNRRVANDAGRLAHRSKSRTGNVRAACVLAFVLAGCVRTTDPQHVSGPDVLKLEPALRNEVRVFVDDRCGTVREPKMLGDASFSPSSLNHASEVYARRCLPCHGVSGDGEGPAARTLIPKPRDYRKGLFKFTSTPYGQRPLREDLERTIRRGIPGTSMPSFELLPKEDLQGVVDYVRLLALRGEYESALAKEAPDYWEDAVTEARGDRRYADPAETARVFRRSFAEPASNARTDIIRRWERAATQIVAPLTPQPLFTAERVTRGRQFFLDTAAGCNKCHGADGRGQTPENLRGDLKDAWGHPTQAADLTAGMLRGGSEPIDVYRRVHSGISGTPMPGFANVFAKEPDRMWDVVAFVLYISEERRRGAIPDAAIGPMPGRAELTHAERGRAHP